MAHGAVTPVIRPATVCVLARAHLSESWPALATMIFSVPDADPCAQFFRTDSAPVCCETAVRPCVAKQALLSLTRCSYAQPQLLYQLRSLSAQLPFDRVGAAAQPLSTPVAWHRTSVRKLLTSCATTGVCFPRTATTRSRTWVAFLRDPDRTVVYTSAPAISGMGRNVFHEYHRAVKQVLYLRGLCARADCH